MRDPELSLAIHEFIFYRKVSSEFMFFKKAFESENMMIVSRDLEPDVYKLDKTNTERLKKLFNAIEKKEGDV